MAALLQNKKAALSFRLLAYYILDQKEKGKVLQFEQEDSILCPDSGDLDEEYWSHRTGTGSILNRLYM